MSDSVRPHRWQPTRLLSLGFSRQEHWSGLPFPSPVRESESEVTQSCPTLSNPMDCSPPGSSDRGIFQARVLEWVVIAFSMTNLDCILKSRDSTLPTKVHIFSLHPCLNSNTISMSNCLPTPSNPMDCSTPGSSIHGIFQARVLEWGAIAFSYIQSTSYKMTV